jgi:transcriptional regulator with XRE-family HTH domain
MQTKNNCLYKKGIPNRVPRANKALATYEVKGLDMQTLAQRLKYTREQKGLTQEELAKLAGTTQQNIQNIESEVVLRPRKIGAIAKVLGTSPAWLQFGAEAIDNLDSEAIQLAQSWMTLEEPQKSALKTAILQIAKPPKPRKR